MVTNDTNFKFGTHASRQSPGMIPEKNSRKRCVARVVVVVAVIVVIVGVVVVDVISSSEGRMIEP